MDEERDTLPAEDEARDDAVDDITGAVADATVEDIVDAAADDTAAYAGDQADEYAGTYAAEDGGDFGGGYGDEYTGAAEDAGAAAIDEAPSGDVGTVEPGTAGWPLADEPSAAVPSPARVAGEPAALDEGERLRQPRAQRFRRRLRTQISMLPLALALIALGLYLSARAFGVDGLPDLSDRTLALGFGGVLAFTAVFHALIFGRRERGLLFVGLLVWVTAGLIYGLVTYIEAEPDPAEWWPIVLVALGVTFFLTYLIERGHERSLVLLAVLTLVAAGAAFAVTSGTIEQRLLDRAAEYWPLLLSVLGLGLLPLAFRRRAR